MSESDNKKDCVVNGLGFLKFCFDNYYEISLNLFRKDGDKMIPRMDILPIAKNKLESFLLKLFSYLLQH